MGNTIAGHLVGMGKKWKPTLQIHASVDAYPPPMAMDETKYLKKDLERYKEEIGHIEKALSEWIPEDVAERAEKSLRLELKRKKARIIEIKASLKALEEDDEEDEEDDD